MPMTGAETAPKFGAARILLVEDDPLSRFTMAEELRDLGISVIEAATADEAWQYLVSGGLADLVFTDHRLPGSLSGRMLATRIQQQYPTIIVVITSAYYNQGEGSEAILAKPYNLFETATDLARRAIARHEKESDI